MSGFAKSIFYSGVVLAIGLISVFSIYSNTDTSGVASIEPAAGQSHSLIDDILIKDVSAILSEEPVAAETQQLNEMMDDMESMDDSASETLGIKVEPAAGDFDEMDPTEEDTKSVSEKAADEIEIIEETIQ